MGRPAVARESGDAANENLPNSARSQLDDKVSELAYGLVAAGTGRAEWIELHVY
jgi:hypothetical protein